VHVNGEPLRQGDAARLDDESRLVLDQADAAEVLVFDLAPLN
jgi:redox-sensitive bicupin YhaK (pirin superfamily)